MTGATSGVEIQESPGLQQSIEWISQPVAADVTISGTITANIWAAESNMSANVAINVVVEVIRANATATANSNTLVQIVKSANVTELAVTTRAVNNFTTTPASTTVNRGDRLRVRVFGDDVGTMASTYTFNASWNGTSAAADGDTFVTFSETITFESAPTLVLSQTLQSEDQNFGITGSTERAAQAFVAKTSSLIEVRSWLAKSNTPTDDVVLQVQTDSTGSPSGSVVGTVATVAAASLTGTVTEYTHTCSVALTPGVTYWLVYTRSGALHATNTYFTRVYGAAVAGWTTAKRYASGAWANHPSSGVATVRFEFADTRSVVDLNNSASSVATASQDLEAWTSRGSGVVTSVTNTAAGWTAPLQATTTAGGTVIDWFTRPLTAFTLTGMAVANIRALESNAAANASLRCEIARVAGDGTSPTVWCSWCCAPTGTDNGELTTSEVARTINLSGDDLAITDGQRLRIRLYNDDISSAAMGASQTVTHYYAGTSGGASGDTYITFPQTMTEYSSGPFTYTKAGYGKEAG